jgi:hypothetical protein
LRAPYKALNRPRASTTSFDTGPVDAQRAATVRSRFMSATRRYTLATGVLVLFALHQDVWFWRDARPLLFGFLPVGLTYHAVYCVAAALLMAALVRFAWPERLEADADRDARR